MPVIIEYAYPTSDISIGVWERSPAGGSLASAIDETSLTSDHCHAVSLPLAGDPDLPYTFGLGLLSDPGIDSGHVFDIWLGVTGFTSGKSAKLELFNGGDLSTALASAIFTVFDSSPTQFTLSLTTTEAAGISNYSNLAGRVTLLSDTTEWGLQLYMARFGVPKMFLHIDAASNSGFTSVLGGSGNYLETSGSGFIRKSGLEGSGSIISPSSSSGFIAKGTT